MPSALPPPAVWTAFLADSWPSVAGLALLVALALRLASCWSRRRGIGRLWAAEEGSTATFEYALVLPFFVGLLLVVGQLALLLNAHLVVTHAAWAAARSAVVWIPHEGIEEAWQRASRAAVVGCVPIAASEAAGGLVGDILDIGGPLADVFGALPAEMLVLHDPALGQFEDPGRVRSRLRQKFTYSKIATSIRINDLDPDAIGSVAPEIGPHDPITVRVTHAFYLTVPYADAIFALFPGGWRVLPVLDVSGSFTLLNEGKYLR